MADVDIATYQRKKLTEKNQEPKIRLRCAKCLQPDFSCFCPMIKPIEQDIQFVILIHPVEIARRIATGRLAHLCLKNSHLIAGHLFNENKSVKSLLADSENYCVLLYPGIQSANLTLMSAENRALIKPINKKLTIFVIDGTWATAKKMVNGSHNLKNLPRICFTPSEPSNFRIRRQPNSSCYSTIEAIHQTIGLLGNSSCDHDHLLEVFDKMVTRQLELAHSKTWSPWF